MDRLCAKHDFLRFIHSTIQSITRSSFPPPPPPLSQDQCGIVDVVSIAVAHFLVSLVLGFVLQVGRVIKEEFVFHWFVLYASMVKLPFLGEPPSVCAANHMFAPRQLSLSAS